MGNKNELNINGVRVITVEKDSEIVSLNIWMNVGSICETDDIRGISHVLEHMIFTGNDTYTKDEIAKKIEGLGGCFNAFTSKTDTVYELSILQENISDVLDMFFGMVFHPTFVQEELDKEKKVVYEEMMDCRDNPWEVLSDFAMKNLFPNSNYRFPIIGFEDTLESITIENLKDYHNKYYGIRNSVIVITGSSVAIGAVVDMIRSLTANSDTGYLVDLDKSYNEPFLEYKFIEKDSIDQNRTIYVFFLPKDSRYENKILNKILGYGFTSKLYRRIREELGLCYSIGSEFTPGFDRDMDMIFISVSYSGKSSEKIILKEINEITKNLKDITEEEFNTAKALTKRALYSANYSPDSITSSITMSISQYLEDWDIDIKMEKYNQITFEKFKTYLETLSNLKSSCYTLFKK